MSCFTPNLEFQYKNAGLLSNNHKRIINNFLRRSSRGNILGIDSIKYRKFESIDSTLYTRVFNTELVLECHCRDGYGFPGMDKLPENMYAVLKPILKDFYCVKLEYHYSMYYSRD